MRLDARLGAAIRQTAQANEATPFMLLLATFQTLLYRYSGQRDIRIGVPNANRPRQETQGLIGFFINTQVWRAELGGRLPFNRLLATTRETTLGAQAHQDLPFEQLLEAFPQAREQGLFQVMFNHQQRDLSALRRLPGMLADELPWHSREAKYDLQLHSEEDRNGRLSLSFDYADELFDTATIERLAEHFVNLLHAVCEQPQQAIGDLQLMRSEPQLWGEAPCAPAQQWLPDLLNAQVSDQTALVWQDGSLSFAQLHTQANRLAHYPRLQLSRQSRLSRILLTIGLHHLFCFQRVNRRFCGASPGFAHFFRSEDVCRERV